MKSYTKKPYLKYSAINGHHFHEASDPKITIDLSEFTESDANDLLATFMEAKNIDTFVNDLITSYKDYFKHVTITSSLDEIETFFNSLVFQLLNKLLSLIKDDKLQKIIENKIQDYANNFISEEDKQKEIFRVKAEEFNLSGKASENYVSGQMLIWQRERRERAEQEAKLLGTAMQQLLPDIFEEKRAIPNCFLRGALFGMVRKGRRALVADMPIFTMSQYDLTFTGYELDQNDLELWDTLIYLAKKRSVENELRVSLYELCQQMRVTNNGKTIEAIKSRISRLKIGTVRIKSNKKEFGGSLINNYYIDTDGDGKLVIEYNKKLTVLFADNDYTLISSDIRELLGENQLARWLYNFYESHKNPIPFSIDFIKKLCRSESELKEFKRMLRTSLEMVKLAHYAVNNKSKWDYEITKNNYLNIYTKGKSKKQMELFAKF